MAKLAELLNGRKLEHDISFAAPASDQQVAGIVDGVQAITATGTVTLSFDTSNTQIVAPILAITPDADRNVLLPPTLSDTDGVVKSLKGRKLTILNSAAGFSRDLTIFESDGTTFVARVGFDASVTIVFPLHGKPFCINDVFVGTCELAASGTTSVSVADAIGAGYTILPIVAYINNGTGGNMNSGITFKMFQGSTEIAASQTEQLNSKNTLILHVNANDAAVATHLIPANVDIKLGMTGALGETATCRMYYRVLKDDLTPMS